MKFVDGKPYCTTHVDAQGNNPVGEETRNAARQAERVVQLAAALKAGLAA